MGLAFDEEDFDYYLTLFRDDIGRDPTNVELFDMGADPTRNTRGTGSSAGTSSSTACRSPSSLFKMVKDTIAGERGHNSRDRVQGQLERHSRVTSTRRCDPPTPGGRRLRERRRWISICSSPRRRTTSRRGRAVPGRGDGRGRAHARHARHGLGSTARRRYRGLHDVGNLRIGRIRSFRRRHDGGIQVPVQPGVPAANSRRRVQRRVGLREQVRRAAHRGVLPYVRVSGMHERRASGVDQAHHVQRRFRSDRPHELGEATRATSVCSS